MRVNLTLDDVVAATNRGKRVVADEKVVLSIPASGSTTGSRRMLRLDVSDEGRKVLSNAKEDRDKELEKADKDYQEALEKLKASHEKAKRNAWGKLNKIADKVEANRSSGKTKKTKDDEREEHQDRDDQSQGSHDQNHDYEQEQGGAGDQQSHDSAPQYDQGYQPQPSYQQDNHGFGGHGY